MQNKIRPPADLQPRSVCLVSLNLGSRSTPPRSPIRTLQLVDWTCLQWAICLGTRWNWCPHLPEAINSKYGSLRSCTAILLPAEYNKVELRWSWRGGGKPARGPQTVMGIYFHQIYTGSHAEWWATGLSFDPRRQGKQRRIFFRPPRVTSDGRVKGGGRRREGKVRWLIGGAAQGQPPLLGWWVKWVRHWVSSPDACPRLRLERWSCNSRARESEKEETRTPERRRFCGFGVLVSRLTFQLNCYHKCQEHCWLHISRRIFFFTLRDLNYFEKCRKCPRLKQESIEVPSFTDSKKMSAIRKKPKQKRKIGTAGAIVHSQKHIKKKWR